MCLDKQGTHSVQVIIEMILTKEEEDFITSEIKGHVSELAIVKYKLIHSMIMVRIQYKKLYYCLVEITKKL